MADPPTTPESFITLQKSIQSALIATTRTTSSLCAEDLPFQRSLDTSFAQELDRQNARLLSLADRLLGRAASVPDVSASTSKQAGSSRVQEGRVVPVPRLRSADELDTNWRAVVDVVDSLLERTDGVLDEVRGVIKKGAAAITEVWSRS
jgi:exosome complex exonuclease RRP6